MDNQTLKPALTIDNAHEHPDATPEMLHESFKSSVANKDVDKLEEIAKHPKTSPTTLTGIFNHGLNTNYSLQNHQFFAASHVNSPVNLAVQGIKHQISQNDSYMGGMDQHPHLEPEHFDEIGDHFLSESTNTNQKPNFIFKPSKVWLNKKKEEFEHRQPETPDMTDPQIAYNKAHDAFWELHSRALSDMDHDEDSSEEAIKFFLETSDVNKLPNRDQALSRFITQNKALSSSQLDRLWSHHIDSIDDFSDIHENILSHPNTDSKLLQSVIQNRKIRYWNKTNALSNPNLDESFRKKTSLSLLNDMSHAVAYAGAISSNPKTTEEEIEHFYKNGLISATNDRVTAPMIEKHYSPSAPTKQIRDILASHKTPPSVLKDIVSNSKNQNLAKEALEHPNADIDVIQAGLSRKAKNIQAAAALHPLVLHTQLPNKIQNGTITLDKLLSDKNISTAFLKLEPEEKQKGIKKFISDMSEQPHEFSDTAAEFIIQHGDDNAHNVFVQKVGAKNPEIYTESLNALANKGNEEARKFLLSPRGQDYLDLPNNKDWHPDESQVKKLFESLKPGTNKKEDRWFLTRNGLSDNLFDEIATNENTDLDAIYGNNIDDNVIRMRYGNLSNKEKEEKAAKYLEKPHTAPAVLSSGLLEHNPDKWNQIYDSLTPEAANSISAPGAISHPHVMQEFLTGDRFREQNNFAKYIYPSLPNYDTFRKIMLSDSYVNPDSLRMIDSDENIDVLNEAIKNNTGGFDASVSAMSKNKWSDSYKNFVNSLKQSKAPIEKQINAIKQSEPTLNSDLFNIANGTEHEREYKMWALSSGLLDQNLLNQHISKHPEDFGLLNEKQIAPTVNSAILSGAPLDDILKHYNHHNKIAEFIVQKNREHANIADYLNQSNHPDKSKVLASLLSERLHGRNGGLTKSEKIQLVKKMGEDAQAAIKKDPNAIVKWHDLNSAVKNTEFEKYLEKIDADDLNTSALSASGAFSMLASASVPDPTKEKIIKNLAQFTKHIDSQNYQQAFRAANAMGIGGEHLAYKTHSSIVKKHPELKDHADRLLALWIDSNQALNVSKPSYKKALSHIDRVLNSPDSSPDTISVARSAIKNAGNDVHLSGEDALRFVLSNDLPFSDAAKYESVLNNPEIFKQYAATNLTTYLKNSYLLDKNTTQALYDRVMSSESDQSIKKLMLEKIVKGKMPHLTADQYVGALRSLPFSDAIETIRLGRPSSYFSPAIKFVNDQFGSADENTKKYILSKTIPTAIDTYNENWHETPKLFDTDEVHKAYQTLLENTNKDNINNDIVSILSKYPYYDQNHATELIVENPDFFMSSTESLVKALRVSSQSKDWEITKWNQLTDKLPFLSSYLLSAARKITLDHLNFVDLKEASAANIKNGLDAADRDSFVKIATARPDAIEKNHIEDKTEWIDHRLAGAIAKKNPDLLSALVSTGAGGKKFAKKQFESKNPKFYLAMSPYINEASDEVIERILAQDGGFHEDIAKNEYANESLLNKMYEKTPKSRKAEVRSFLAKHPNVPKEIFNDIVKHQKVEDPLFFSGPGSGPEYIRNFKYGFDEFSKIERGLPESFKKVVDLEAAPVYVSVNTNLDRLNQLLPHMTPEGLTWQSAKKLIPAIENWHEIKKEFLAQPKHTMMPEKLTDIIAGASNKDYGITFSEWKGMQRHSDRNNLVVQLNLGQKMQKELSKDLDVWAVYKHIQDSANSSGHPSSPYGIGWARLDLADPKSLVIEEFQSDLAKHKQSVLKELIQDRDSVKLYGRTIPTEKIKTAISVINDIIGDWHKATVAAVESFAKSQGYEKIYLHGLGLRYHLSDMRGDRQMPAWLTEMYDRYPRKNGWEECDYSDYPNYSKDKLSTLQLRHTSTKCWVKKIA